MKYFACTVVLLLFISTLSIAQSFRGLDRSPLDIAYLPDHFAHDRYPGQKAVIKITYSRPQKKGREIFGAKVPFGQIWRTGANEATEVKVYQDITVGGEKLKAGSYSLFTIPGEKEWTIIFNSDLDYWGAYSYKVANDVLRIKVSATTMPEVLEAFSIQFEDKGDNTAHMKLAWDRTLVEVPVKY